MNVKLKMILISASIVLMLAAALGVIIIGRSGVDYEERLEQAGIYLENRDYDNAIAIYNRIISENRTCAEAYAGLSEAYFSKDNTDKALEVLEKGARNTDNDDIVMDKRAELFPDLEYASALNDDIYDDEFDDFYEDEDTEDTEITSVTEISETEPEITEVSEESVTETESETTVTTTAETTVPTTAATTAQTTAAPVIVTTAPPVVTAPPATTQTTVQTTVATTTETTTEALKDVSVADFTKMSLDEAYEWCSKNNVILSVVGTENNSSRIISQSPAPSSTVKENSSVIVVLDE